MSDETLSNRDHREMHSGTESGIARGTIHARIEWIKAVKWIIYSHAEEHETFTANDLRDRIVKISFPTPDGRALAGVLRAALKAGIIEMTGVKVPSVRGHKSMIEVWRSKIYKKKAVTVPML